MAAASSVLVSSVIVTATVPVRVTAAGPSLVDTFSRPDNWQIGAAETGQPWELWSGTAVVAGETAAASVAGYTLVVADSGETSGTVAVTVPTISDDFWLIVRASNSGNYWRFGRSGGGAYGLDQIKGWALGAPAIDQLASVAPAAGDRLECRLATGITCSVNGVAVVATVDAFNRDAAHVGFAMWDGSAAPLVRFDDVQVDPPAPAADVRVDVAPVQTPVAAGEPVTWALTVTNVGTAIADGVTLTVPVPAGMAGINVSASVGTCTGAPTVTCQLESLGSGQSVTATATGTAPASPQDVVVTASVQTTTGDADPHNDVASSTIVVEAAVPPNAVVVDNFTRPDSWSMGTAPTGQTWEVWSGTARVAGGQAIASEPGYALAVLDTGTADGSVYFTVPTISSDYWLIARATNSGNYWRFGRSAGGAYELQQVRGWALGSPPVDRLASVTPAAGDVLECRYRSGITCFVNGVAVASSRDTFNADARYGGFAGFGATSAPAVRFDHLRATTPTPAPDLVVDVATSATWVLAETPMQWTATVRNTGDQPATGVVLGAAIPTGLAALGATGAGASCGTADSTISCTLGTLAAGSSTTVTYTATAPRAIATYALQVVATSSEVDADLSTNRATGSISSRVLAGPGESTRDDFNRPDAAVLGSTADGRPWEALRGSFGVVGGTAAKTDTSPGLSIATVDPGFTYGTMQVRVTAGAANGFSVVFRARDADNHYRVGPDAAGNYRVQKLVNGRVTELQFNAIRANVPAVDGDVIRVVLRPDDGWFVAINGVHVLDGGDTELMKEFRFGLAAASGAVRFDDLTISPTVSTGITTIERFDHPAESHLELRQPTSGTRYWWFTPEGYWVTRNGAGVLDSPGFGLAFVETSSHLATVGVTVRSSVAEEWLVFRRADDGSHYRFGHLSNRRYVLQRIDSAGQVAAIPGGVSTAQTLRAVAGDRIEIQQSASGGITARVNGAIVASATDGTNGILATAYGMAGTRGASFDDVSVTPP